MDRKMVWINEGFVLDVTGTLIATTYIDLREDMRRTDPRRADVDQYWVSPCKPIIDEIDRVLAQHYGFTD